MFEQKEISIFKKKPYLNIQLLQTRSTHIKRNKLSDICSYRDIEFYEMYKKKKSGEDLAKLAEKNFPMQVGVDELYSEIEVPNVLAFLKEKVTIEDAFGKSI